MTTKPSTVREQLWQIARDAGYDFMRAAELADEIIAKRESDPTEGEVTYAIGNYRIKLIRSNYS